MEIKQPKGLMDVKKAFEQSKRVKHILIDDVRRTIEPGPDRLLALDAAEEVADDHFLQMISGVGFIAFADSDKTIPSPAELSLEVD